MFHDKKVVVVMPAYNAARTLKRTYDEVMDQRVVDLVIVVDDASRDETTAVARTLPHTIVHVHPVNSGYGANQKSCYRLALEAQADIVIMVHPDYQYTPRLIPAMVAMVGSGLYSCVLASRILGGNAMHGGMPIWKYISNRFLTLSENLILGTTLSEYHTGYRAYSRQLLERLQFDACSDDFVFDNQILAQILWLGEIISEVSVLALPTLRRGCKPSITRFPRRLRRRAHADQSRKYQASLCHLAHGHRHSGSSSRHHVSTTPDR